MINNKNRIFRTDQIFSETFILTSQPFEIRKLKFREQLFPKYFGN